MTKNPEKSQLSPRQRLAIAGLAHGKSIEEVARSLGLSRTTIEKWKAKKEFRQAIDNTVSEIVVSEVISGLQAQADGQEKTINEIKSRIEGILNDLPPKTAIWPLLHYLRYLSDMQAQRKNYVLELWKRLYADDKTGEQVDRIRVIIERLTDGKRDEI